MGLLSEVLNPILDHKLPGRGFRPGPLNEWRNTLVSTGVLSPAFARHLWGNTFLRHAPQSSTSQFESALFEVLIKLGVAFPLGGVPLPEAVHGSQSAPADSSGIHTQRDMLVWRWLPETLGDHGEATLKALVEQLGDGAQEVTLKWEFDSAGAPRGLMERLIALCHVVGEAEMALCWRSGAVFQSPPVTDGTHPPYVVELRYGDTERVLSVTMFGTLRSGRVWAVLRFVASLMVNLSKDWPGALWAGWVKCSDHPLRRLYLATPTEVCAHRRFFLGLSTALRHFQILVFVVCRFIRSLFTLTDEHTKSSLTTTNSCLYGTCWLTVYAAAGDAWDAIDSSDERRVSLPAG